MTRPPWFVPPRPLLVGGGRALVLGAGLAGATMAHALASRGIEVTIVERHPHPGMGTSGNPAGVVLPQPTLADDTLGRFFLAAYHKSLAFIADLEACGAEIELKRGGVFQVPYKRRLQHIYKELREHPERAPHMRALDLEETRHITGLPFHQGVLFYPEGFSVNPGKLCRHLIDHPGIHFIGGIEVADIQHVQGKWQLIDANKGQIAAAPILVLADGLAAFGRRWLTHIPVRPAWGQLIQLPGTAAQILPKTIACHHGYLIPDVSGEILLGASWRGNDDNQELSLGEQQQLIEEANHYLPGIELTRQHPLVGRVGCRVKSVDHLPLLGSLPDEAPFRRLFEDLHHGRTHDYPPPPYHDGLFVSLCHGARGLLSAPICAAQLAASLCGEEPPLPDDLAAAIHPARFLIRRLRRKPENRGIQD